MKTKIKTEELDSLLEFINSNHVDGINEIRNDLNKAIYLLHYLQDDHILGRERHQVCFTLWHINQSLYEIQKNH